MLRTALGKLFLVTLSLILSFSSLAQNQALDLSGTLNEINVTYDLNTSGFTVEQWVYFPTLSTGGSLVNQTSGNLAAPLDIYVQGDGTINLWTGDGTTTTNQISGAVITQATWHHVAVVYDPADVGNERKLYVDGNSTPVLTGASPALLNIGPVRIGRRDDDFEGDDAYFDEVRIWNIPRTGPQIAADYNTTINHNTAGLDVYLKFENSLQDLAPGNGDQSGAIVAGSIGYVQGAPLQNNALSFDGTDDLVNLGSVAQFNIGTTFTFETWINLDSYPASFNAMVFNKWQSGLEDKIVAITPSGNVLFNLFGTSVNVTSPSSVPLSQWVHIAATYDGANANIYINGALDISAAASGDAGDGAGSMYLGGNGDGRSPTEFEYLDGSLDEVRFWNVPRTQNEIHTSAYTAVPPSGALTAYYDFDLYVASGDNSGAVNLYDAGGNVLDGTLTGPFALIGSTSNWVTSTAWDNDVFAPLLSNHIFNNVTDTEINIDIEVNEVADLFYVITESAAAPTSTQVIAGDDENGLPASFSNSYGALGPGVITRNISGLNAGTSYYIYWVARDPDSNLSAVYQDSFTTDALANSALTFDGSDDYVSGTGIDLTSGDFTVEAWFNTNSVSTTQTILSVGSAGTNNQSFHIRLNQTEIVVDMFFDGVTIPYIVSSGWHLLSVSHNSASRESSLYIDGVLIGSGTHLSNFVGNTDFAFGRDAWSATNYFNGQIDEIRIWSELRSGAEIAAFYNHEIGTASNLSAYYQMNDGSGTILTDSQGGDQNGTINGGAVFNTTGPLALNLAISGTEIAVFGNSQEIISGDITPDLADHTDYGDVGIGGTEVRTFTIVNTGDTDLTISDIQLSGGEFSVGFAPGAPAPYDFSIPASSSEEFDINFDPTSSGGQGATISVLSDDSDESTYLFDILGNGIPVQNALAFDGIDDYVEIPDDPSLDITSDLTIETWVRFSSVVNEETVLVSKWNPDALPTPQRAYLLQVSATSDLGFLVSNDGTTGAEGVNFSAVQANYSFGAGRWYHVVGTYSPSNALRIYVNGELIGENTTNIMPSIFDSNSSVVLGANGNFGEVGAGNVGTGVAMELDETRIWSIEKSQADIQNDMFNTLTGSVTNLNASYTYDYTSGTTLLDDGSLGNDGTLNDNNDGVADGSTTGPIWGTSTVYDTDIVAPFNVTGYPFIDNITENGLQITTQLSEIGLLSYVVIPDGANVPGADDVRGGTDGLGTPGVAAGTISVSTPFSEFSTLVSGLSASTNYDVYMVAEDLEGVPNVQNNVDFFDVTTNAAPVQNALDFDGTDDYINVGVQPSLELTAGTIEAWFNTSGAGASFRSIIALPQRYFLGLEDNVLVVYDWGLAGSVSTGINVADGLWHHAAFSFQNGVTDGSVIYLDGQEVLRFTYIGDATSTTPFQIGAQNGAQNFAGWIDEVRVWNSIRNHAEIAFNRFSELDPGLHADMVAYYQFNESTGTNVPDVKNAINGTWNGAGGGAYTAPQWIASTALDIPPHIVTNTNDTGTGSLRDAITYANSNPGTTISFLIDEPAPWEINLATALPQITAANTIIDGTTQPEWIFGDANGMVTINGSNLGINGINIDAAGAEVYGLILTNFNGSVSNGHIYLASDAADNAIIGAVNAGNIIHSSAGSNGIYIVGGDNAIIQGNRIGTLDGTTPASVGDHGIATTGEVNTLTIGGDFFTGEGNLISGAGSSRYGLNLNGSGGGSGLSNVDIRGNLIGTNASADGAIPNQLGGVNIQGTVSAINIGGSSPSDLNIISGNNSHGIRLQAGDDININGNYIGIQSDGSSGLSNSGNGIQIETSPTNVNIGDTYQNIISDNLDYGIFFNSSNSLNTTLGNNVIICNVNGGIGFNTIPATTTPTIQGMTLGGATVLAPEAADGSTVIIWVSDDGCSNNQASAFYATETILGGQADFVTAFAPGAHYTATVNDPATGISEFSSSFFLSNPYPSAEGAGEALSFNGTNSNVDLGISAGLQFERTDAFTIETWYNTIIQTQQFLISNAIQDGSANQGIDILMGNSSGLIRVLLKNNDQTDNEISITSNNGFADGNWHHLAVSYDGTSLASGVKIYVDGVLQPVTVNMDNLSGSIVNGNEWNIGSRDQSTGYFTGQLDEIRIWNVAREEFEIRQDMTHKLDGLDGSLVAYYRMDDSGDGATLRDFNNGNDGSISGATYTSSGAHIGDESSYEYSGTGLIFYDFEVVNPDASGPLHIYRVNQAPATATVLGLNNVTDSEYYGVFAPGLNYSVVYYYPGLSADNRLVSRDDANFGWSDQGGFFGTIAENEQLVSATISGSRQFASAIDPTPYPTEQGAGYALDFDGSSDVNISSVDLSAGAFTIETWFKTSQASPYLIVVNENGSTTNTYAVINLNAGQVRFVLREPPAGSGGTSITSTELYNDDQWHHVAGVYDGINNMTLYVDGVQVAQSTSAGASSGYLTDVSLGKNFPNATGQLIGQLDEVRIWNTALIESDIRQYMIEKLGAGHPAFGNLVAAYKFDENNASTAIDVAGGNDGTITGATPVISGAPQGDGSLFTYTPGPFKFDTAPDDDVVVEIDDASNGFHIYYVAGTPNQDQADGFSTITAPNFYGVFAPGQTVDIRMDYNNGGSQDPDKRILYRENGADNAASGGWERLSGLLNNDPTTDSLYAFNVPSGQIVIADLATPSTYPLIVSNDPGDALDFDGTSQYVQGPDLTGKITGDFTLEAWVSTTSPGAMNIVSIGANATEQEVSLKLRSTNQLSVTPNGINGPSSGVANNDGGWYHVVGVYEGTTLSLYLNGAFVNSVSTNLNLDLTQFRIGANASDASQPWIGQIDEVRIWNAAVSAVDIANYANTNNLSSHPNYSDMVAYYRFDDGTGSTILEDLFGGNDGTLVNMDENTDWVASGAFAGDPEIEVTGLGNEIVSGDNTPDVADDTDFGDGGVSHPVVKTFTINNTGTADLILGPSAAGASGDTAFEVGQQPDETVTAGGSTTFTVVFRAPAEGVYNSQVQINSNDADESFYTFDVTGNGIAAAPFQQTNNIVISNVTDNTADISWTFGTFESYGVVVAMFEGNDTPPSPTDNTTYVPSTTFGSGDELSGGSGWYVVYAGGSTSVSVTGLNPGQEYTVAAFEYYGDPGAELYNISPDLDNPNSFITTGGSGNPTINEDFESGNIPSADYSGTVSLGSGDWFANSMSPETSNTQSGANAIAFNTVGDYIESFEIPEGVVDIAFSVNQNTGAGGDLDILVSTDGGSSFSPIDATGEITNITYQEYIISIGSFEPTIIRIEATSASEPLFLDDITIQVQGASPSGYFEDFSIGIPGDWITFNAMWDSSPSNDFSGVGGSANIQSGAGNYLETPYLNGVNDISFQYKSGVVNTDGFVFDVLASSDGGLTFDIVVADNVTDIGNSYTEFTHNFGSIYDGPIRIEFDGAGDTEGFIDDFSTDGTLGGGSGPSIFEDFESGTVPSADYSGTLSLGSGDWESNSLSPESTNVFSGLEAISFNAVGDYLQSFEITEGVDDISFYVNQATGAGGELDVQYSTDGGSIFNSAGLTGEFSFTEYGEIIIPVGTTEPTFIRIEAVTTNEPIYLDDITININDGGGSGTTDYALDFDGSDDHLVAASITELGITNGTIEAWIYPNNLDLDGSSPQRILAKPSGAGDDSSPYQLIITDGGAIRLTIGNGGASVSFDSNTGIVQPGMWQHIGVSWDGSNVRFFYDGVEDLSFVQSMTPNTNASSLIIGGFNGIPGTGQFSGAIDDVRIWNFARTETEINSDKDFLLMGNEPGLVAYYPMSEGTGSLIASDKSNNANDATLTGMDENTDWIDGPGLVDPGGGGPGVPRRIYFTTPGATDVYQVDITGGTEESLVASNTGADFGIAYSALYDQVVYIDGSSGLGDRIMAVNSDGSSPFELVDLGTNGSSYGSLAIDSLSSIIYAITPTGLQAWDLSGGSFINNYGNILIGSVGSVSDIEIYNGVLYWSQSGTDNGIASADLTDIAGTSQLLVDPGVSGFIRGLTIDPQDGKLYWTNDQGEIRRSNLDGSNEEVLTSGLSNLEDIEMNYENRHLIYVTENLNATIESIDTEGTPQGTLLTFTGAINYIHPYSMYNVIGAPSFNFFEDFDTGLTASTDPSFILSSGIWAAQGVQSVAAIDPNLARNGEGDAAYMFFGTGNYLISPYLTNVNEISFFYKADPISAGTFDFEVYGSSDGGTTFDNLLGSGSTDGTEFIEFTHSFGSPYDGPIQIIYTAGGSESGVIDDFGSDGSELRSTLNLSSLVLGNRNVAPGETDVLIYKIRMDVTDADVTSEGFFITPVGSFNPSDIQNNSIRIYQSIGSDVPDPINDGTFLGSTNIASGDPIIPDGAIGLLFTQNYIVGDEVYYYVILNIDAGATPGNSFNIEAPLANDNFGFINADQFDNGLQAGDVFTISSGDVTAPGVVAVNTSLTVVSEGDSELEVLVEFDEEMIADGSQDPVITFPVEDASATLSFSSGVWDDGFNYTGFFTVSDANETISGVDVRVSGAQDLAGNTMTDHDAPNVFSIDTENPTVVSITRASADPTNGPSVDFEVTFSESVNDIDSDDFGVTTVSGDATGTLSLFTGASGTTATVSVFGLTGNGTIRLDYLNTNLDGVVDDNGNPSETDYLSGEVYTVDNIVPAVTIDSKSTSITSPEITGTVDDPNATIEVTILGNTFTATNNGSTWTLPQGTISPALGNGTYNVQVDATDLAGNVGSDATVDELVVQLGVTGLMASVVNSTSITMVWDAGLDADFYELDVSTEASFATFLTGYDSKVIGTESETITGLDYSNDYYFRIRLVNTQGEASSSSASVNVRTIRDAATAADSVALRQIYDATGGIAWTPAVNWTSAYMRDWDNITLNAARTRIRRVDFPSVGASGDMPNPFVATTDPIVGALDMNNALSALNRMDVSGNQLTGLMDFAPTAMDNLNVSGNNLEFDDLEPLLGITTLDYSNQASVSFLESTDGTPLEVRYNNDYSLSVGSDGLGVGGSANVYTWYRNNEVISTGTSYFIGSSELVILAIAYENMGEFRAEVTSTLVPGLTIDVDPQIVWAIADMQVSITDANGDPLSAPFNAYMLETTRTPTGYRVLETLENQTSSTFTFPDVVLGDYITFVESDLELYIPTYFGDVFEWTEAEVLLFRSDDVIEMTMTEVPPELKEGDGDGTLDVLIEEDFGDDGGRVDARRRAAKRKCGLRRKRSGGRTDQEGDEYELIAYGETDDNGQFKFGFLPSGTYRFFVEYPGIPLDESSFVEFDVGEAGISDTDFKLEAFATPDGIEVTIEAVLGIILEYFKDLEIYPNPSSEYLNIRYRHLKSNDVTAQLVDLSGNTKWSTDLRNGFDGELRIDVSDYEDGIYILRFYDRENPNGNVVSYRVMVRD